MLSKKIYSSLRHTQTLSRNTYLRSSASGFGSCGSGGGCSTGGGCGTMKKSLTTFSPEIAANVMANMPTTMAQPTLRNTKIREAYSEEFDRTPHCQGATKKDNWERDIPLMSI
jgi:hypothetical protein